MIKMVTTMKSNALDATASIVGYEGMAINGTKSI